MPKLVKTKPKRQKQQKSEKLSDKEYAKFLAKNGMKPSQGTIEAAKGENKPDEMTDTDYEKFLMKSGMKPVGYVEQNESDD